MSIHGRIALGDGIVCPHIGALRLVIQMNQVEKMHLTQQLNAHIQHKFVVEIHSIGGPLNSPPSDLALQF